MIIFSAWFSIRDVKPFWPVVIEKCLFNVSIYFLFVALASFIKQRYFGSSLTINWEFFGFSFACIVIFFQQAYVSQKKRAINKDS